MSRVAAVDYGRRRVGLAVSDPLGLTVRGLDTLHRDADLEAAAGEVAARLLAEGAERIVVGLPLHASGEESEMSREVRRFAGHLGRASGLPVEFFDEGLTSWEAEERIRARGRSVHEARRSGDVDREAACALLRSWLQEGENRPPDS